jgi:rhodanese-related sulfurtransferase
MLTEKPAFAALAIAALIAFCGSAVYSAETAVPAAKPSIAKICTNCHKAEPNKLRGYYDNVSFKGQNLQIRIDDSIELVRFDEDKIRIVAPDGKTGDGELLKDNKIKKGHEVTVEYLEKDGVKTAQKMIAKPPVKIPAEMLLSTADMEKLVAQGPEKGKYFLFDSRPLPRFQEGAIPTAFNLPYPAFDKMAEKLLPGDKNSLIIFYCSGPTCNMSPGSADKARKLGYTNIKVYKDGMPAWSLKNYGTLSVQSLKEAWIDKGIPHVLLDVRATKESGQGFIKGAVSFPAHHNAAPLIEKLDLKKNVPIILYDGKGSEQAAAVAHELIKVGYMRVMVVNGGFEAWQAARFEASVGTPADKVVYVPKPRAGEIDLDEFRKYAATLPANVMIIDVRTPTEAKTGILKTAKLIPFEEIKERLAEIPKDKLIITQCNTGVLAEMAYHALKELGYSNVRFVNAKLEFDKKSNYTITSE